MASKNQRRQMKAAAKLRHSKVTNKKDPKEIALFLIEIDNAAKSARKSERRRKILERKDSYGSSD